MEVLAIVQARCSSSRLPGKVLKELAGRPMILQELTRLGRSKKIDRIVLATSTEESDSPLADVLSDSPVDVFRGNLDDVLDRYYQCARKYQPSHVVRITGDCPMIDWRIVDSVITQHIESGNDYTATNENFPDGLDTEVMRFSALEKVWAEAKLKSEREHVTLYIRNNKEKFKIGYLACRHNLSAMRWTVDEQRDFDFVQKVYEELYPQSNDFSTGDVLNILKIKPELLKINSGIVRNEGLLKSLAEDTIIV